MGDGTIRVGWASADITPAEPLLIAGQFHVQPAGGYVPTERAVAGRSCAPLPANNPVGLEGGQEVVVYTLAASGEFWGGHQG